MALSESSRWLGELSGQRDSELVERAMSDEEDAHKW